jgi:serine/threonine protein kinase
MTSTLTHSFQVKRRLGVAQYGDVLLCESPESLEKGNDYGNLLAVKRLFLNQIQTKRIQGKTMEDPVREVEIAQKILIAGGHENIVKYHTAFVQTNCMYIVMEYCNQFDLFHHLEMRPDNRFGEQEALSVMAQIVSGVAFLHQQGIAHRDLSLENILVHDGLCKISDFGLSTTDRHSCETVGKAYYMAPEVVAGCLYDPLNADVWSLGMVLFIMLTGSPLVEIAREDNQAYRAFCHFGVRKVLEQWGVVVSEATIQLLEGMLHRDPSKRYDMSSIVCHPALDSYIKSEVAELHP